MILIITNDYVDLDGKPLSPSLGLHLAPDTWSSYHTIVGASSDQSITYLPETRKIFIKSHQFGIWPLSYHCSPGLIIVSHSASQVAQALKQLGHALQPDNAAIWESLLFAFPLRQRTLFQGIYKTRIGESLTLHLDDGRVETHGYWRPRLYGNVSSEHCLDDAIALFREIFVDVATKGPLLLPLSGGLDSRLMAAMLAGLGADVRAFTFGSFGSAEVPLAKRVAQILAIPWFEMALRPEDYIRYGEEVVELTGGTLSPMHMHLFSCLSRIEPQGRVVLHGFLGDHVAGDHACGPRAQVTAETARQELQAEFCGRAISAIPPDAYEQIQLDLAAVLDDCQASNSPGCLLEYLSVAERQNMIAYIPAVMETRAPALRPYADERFVSFFLSLSPELRIGRSLFRQVGAALFPDIFRLPSTAYPFGAQCPPFLTRGLMRARNVAQYASSAVSGGRFVAFSPYIYEQQAFLLKYVLRQQAAVAVELVSDLLSVDLRKVVARMHRNRRPAAIFAMMGVANIFKESVLLHIVLK